MTTSFRTRKKKQQCDTRHRSENLSPEGRTAIEKNSKVVSLLEEFRLKMGEEGLLALPKQIPLVTSGRGFGLALGAKSFLTERW